MQSEKNENFLENVIPLSEAPKKIHIAEQTLRNWRVKGKYPQLFIKIGGRVFVDIAEFIEIVKRQKAETIEKAKNLGLYE